MRQNLALWMVLALLGTLIAVALPHLFIWLLSAALAVGVMLAFGLVLTAIDQWSRRG